MCARVWVWVGNNYLSHFTNYFILSVVWYTNLLFMFDIMRTQLYAGCKAFKLFGLVTLLSRQFTIYLGCNASFSKHHNKNKRARKISIIYFLVQPCMATFYTILWYYCLGAPPSCNTVLRISTCQSKLLFLRLSNNIVNQIVWFFVWSKRDLRTHQLFFSRRRRRLMWLCLP